MLQVYEIRLVSKMSSFARSAAFRWSFLAALLTAATHVSPSAIPMWEFLGKTEKVNYLFNSFSKRVTEFCGESTLPDCDKELLVHAVGKLHRMSEEALDRLDPYQRGAADILWESLAKDHPFANKKNEPDDSNNGSEDNYLGSDSSLVEDINGWPGNGIGPLVSRLLPDGKPVPEDAAGASTSASPTDEDAEEVALRSKPAPSISDIERGNSTAATEPPPPIVSSSAFVNLSASSLPHLGNTDKKSSATWRGTSSPSTTVGSKKVKSEDDGIEEGAVARSVERSAPTLYDGHSPGPLFGDSDISLPFFASSPAY